MNEFPTFALYKKTFNMNYLFVLILSLFLASSNSIYTYKVKDIDGKDMALSDYKGKVVIIVNVASKCGFTPQYADLQKLYEKYKSRGVVILGFPCNQFMGQEPGGESEIKAFCTSKYNVSFPMFAKVDVKGSAQAPLYTYLTSKAENGVADSKVSWNFQKYIIGKDGKLITSFSPPTNVFDAEFIKTLELALN